MLFASLARSSGARARAWSSMLFSKGDIARRSKGNFSILLHFRGQKLSDPGLQPSFSARCRGRPQDPPRQAMSNRPRQTAGMVALEKRDPQRLPVPPHPRISLQVHARSRGPCPPGACVSGDD
jgi:hypothetical protein